jgi:hypothetical protein
VSNARRVRRIGVAGLCLTGVGAFCFMPRPALADDNTHQFVFRGSASAVGARFIFNAPGFPGTDTPIDSGGPTATVKVDSLGGSVGYAALPDPGEFATTVPGLAAGLAAGGAGGLPPAAVPTLPNYPLFVSTDATTNPHQEIGEGPYRIDADSKSDSGSANAMGGFRISEAGNAGLVTSEASVIPDADDVVSTATSRIQSLVIGPITVAEVVSTATETLRADGKVTPSSFLQIAAMRIGGQPVSVSQDRLNLPGPSYPLPADDSTGNQLKSYGISMRLVTAQPGTDKVVAPALVITLPAAIAGFSDGGTFTIVLGGATAVMDGNSTTAPGLAPASPAHSSGGASATGPGVGDANAVAATYAAQTPAMSVVPAAHVPAESPVGQVSLKVTGTPPATQTITYNAVAAGNSVPLGPGRSLDVRWMYLPVAVAAVVIIGLGQLIQNLGVRRRWNSGAG